MTPVARATFIKNKLMAAESAAIMARIPPLTDVKIVAIQNCLADLHEALRVGTEEHGVACGLTPAEVTAFAGTPKSA